MTLVILAAGLGSRFGGLKQLEEVGPNGELLIHYSVYDAKKAGFNKILFVIRKEMYNDFKTIVEDKINGIEIDYVFQENKTLENIILKERKKPLGTGHAILCCKEKIKGNFGVINSDDFYGYDAFKTLYNALSEKDNMFYLIAYNLIGTLSKYGSVKRGVCTVLDDKLININECELKVVNNTIIATDLSTNNRTNIEEDSVVSMGMYGLNYEILKFMDKDIIDFFKNNKDLDSEYFLPDAIKKMTKFKLIETKVLNTNSKWLGMTYKSDLEEIREEIKNMIKDNIYPNNLF